MTKKEKGQVQDTFQIVKEQNLLCLQVVMPTVKDDVAFGLSRFNLTHDEITSRVEKALDAVGMYEYLQVSRGDVFIVNNHVYVSNLQQLLRDVAFLLYFLETSSNS